MKTIVAGSRTVKDRAIVDRAIEESGFAITEVVSGGAVGVDQMGEQWADDHRVAKKRFLPDRQKYGWPRAAFVRNEAMGDYAGALIAVWDGASNGTRHMIEYARRRGLRVHVHLCAPEQGAQQNLFQSGDAVSCRPLSFIGENCASIARGLKTETRRVAYPQPLNDGVYARVAAGSSSGSWGNGLLYALDGQGPPHWRCPYGRPGEQIYVREVWARVEPFPSAQEDYRMPLAHRVAKNPVLLKYWLRRVIFLADFPGKQPEQCGRGATDNQWRSPVTMPRWASRQLLTVLDVSLERLQAITEEGAHAEGVLEPAPVHGRWCDLKLGREGHWSYRKPFSEHWDKLNGEKHPWSSNPFVWVVKFRRLDTDGR
jgi:hypothetical protein